MNWILSRITMLIELTYSPGIAFSRPLHGPGFLVPLVVFSSLLIAISLLQAPLQLDWMEHRMQAAGMTAEQIKASTAIFEKSSRMGTALVPGVLLVRWLATALLIWLTAQLFLHRLRFSSTLTIVGYSYLPVLLRDVTVLLVLLNRSEELRSKAGGLNVALGLNLLLPQVPAPWDSVLGSINMFEVWYVVLLAIGVAAATQRRWQGGLTIILPVWVFVTMVQLGFASLGALVRNQLTTG